MEHSVSSDNIREQSNTINSNSGADSKRSSPNSKPKKQAKLKKPKRGRNPFLIFSAELRPKLKKEESEINSNEMMKKLAERWWEISAEEKKIYNALAASEKDEYEKKLKIFKEAHPDETIRNRTKNNYDKKPPSCYGIFVREMTEIIRKEMKPEENVMANILPIIAGLWRKLCQEEREHYKEISKREEELRETAEQRRLNKKKRRRNKKKGDFADQQIQTPKLKKKLKIEQESCDIIVQNEVSEENKLDSRAATKLEIPLQDTITLSESLNSSDNDFEDPDKNVPEDKIIKIDDYEFLLTAWKLSKQKSLTNGLMSRRGEAFAEEEADLYAFLSYSEFNGVDNNYNDDKKKGVRNKGSLSDEEEEQL